MNCPFCEIGEVVGEPLAHYCDGCLRDIDVDHKHTCYCGTGGSTPHEIGTNGCVRFMTDPPEMLPGETLDYPYKQQRGYSRHLCGCWSRWPGSENPLEA
jgi:hypothetical protein